MKKITSIEIQPDNSREILPGFSDDFPYICSRAEIDRYSGKMVPWHWHNAIELFYIESGELEYSTPGGRQIFSAGSGGFINSGVLHMTRPLPSSHETVQLLHMFDPLLISGSRGGRIEEKYVLPLLTSGCEMLILDPGNPIMKSLKSSFELDEKSKGYELHMRSVLSHIWLHLADMFDTEAMQGQLSNANEKLKHMMVYVHQHYSEQIRTADLAKAVHCSQRECYRLFRDQLHCSPLEYITSYRLQLAADMLQNEDTSITLIAQNCGFGTSSHFSKIFGNSFGCSPRQYRLSYHNRDKNRHK